ncbi:MAG: nucleotidyl transferase AbiEii/AbiGii toxin family protein [Sulfuricella sp.]|nr:nucleotidyl transferase AbiEii/AbiGii toxin family protein [Sulfuricella sp.]
MFYLDLFRSLERHRVRYLLVGGLAMNLHGVPRMTMDVDLALALDSANLQGFFDAVRELGLKPALPVSLEDLCDVGKRAEWVEKRNMIAFALQGAEKNVPTVDVLIGVELPFEQAYCRRETRDLAGVPISLASVEDMIALKEQAGRAQDISDIQHLKSGRQ